MAAVLAHPRVTEVIDLAAPACVILGLVANKLAPERAREITAGYAERLAPGSVVVITVACNEDAGLSGRLAEAWGATARPLANYTLPEVAALFGALEILPPGVGPVARAGSGLLVAVGEVAWKMYAAGGSRSSPRRAGSIAEKHAGSGRIGRRVPAGRQSCYRRKHPACRDSARRPGHEPVTNLRQVRRTCAPHRSVGRPI